MVLLTFFLAGGALIEALLKAIGALTVAINERIRLAIWKSSRRAARKRPVIW